MRDRQPNALGRRGHCLEMLGVQRGEVNVRGIPFARSASRSSEGRIAQHMAIGRGFVADTGKARKTFRIFTSVCPVQQ